jgi:hypothetical protein
MVRPQNGDKKGPRDGFLVCARLETPGGADFGGMIENSVAGAKIGEIGIGGW